ncbi:MAG: PAS domain S-box protein, partial [Candidatus Diapherotrites archaeon]|nr:PAS domain S-box protein [Candidatus Diapherotrites archaeon]
RVKKPVRKPVSKKRVVSKTRAVEEWFKPIVETTPQFIAIVDKKGRYVYSNKFSKEFPREKLIGSDIYRFVHLDDKKRFKDAVMTVFKTGKPKVVEIKSLGQGGKVAYYLDHLGAVKKAGKVENVVIIAADVTAHRRSEQALRESEDALRRGQEFAQVGTWELDLSDMSTKWSDEHYRIFGFKPGAFKTKQKDFRKFIHPADRKVLDAAFKEMLRDKKPHNIEYRIIRKDGNERVLQSRAELVLDVKGKPIKMRGTVQDITTFKKAKAQALSSEGRFKYLFDGVNDAIFLADVKSRKILDCNAAAVRLMGYSRKELLSMRAEEIHSKDIAKSMLRTFLSYASGKKAGFIETTVLTKKGKRVPVEINPSIVLEDNNVYMQAVVRNISKRKEAEQAAQKELQLRDVITTSVNAGLVLLDNKTRVLFANKTAQDWFGSLKQLKGLPCCEAFGITRAQCIALTVLKTGKFKTSDMFVKTVRGTKRYFYVVSSPNKDATGKITGITEIVIDITERKNLERDLGKRVKELSSLYAVSKIIETPGLSLNEVIRRVLRVLPSAYQFSESCVARIKYDSKDVKSKCFKKTKWCHSAPILAGKKKVGLVEVCYLKKLPFLKEEVNLISGVSDLLGVIIDRKLTEDRLEQARESLATAQQVASVGNWDWDIVNNTLSWSDEIYRVFGVKPQEFGATYDAFVGYVHPDDRKFVMDSVNAALKGKLYSIDHRIVLKGGSERIVHETGKVFRKNGKPVRMVGTVQDVTERRRTEVALSESEERYRGLSDAAHEGIIIHDKGRVVESNKRGADLFGYKLSEFIGTSIISLIAPESLDLVKRNVAAGYEKAYDAKLLRKNGTIFDADLLGKEIINKGQKSRLVAVRDITEKKESERALKTKLQ